MLLRTIISPPGTKATLSTSSTIPVTQLLLPVVVGTIVMKSAKPLTSVSVPQIYNPRSLIKICNFIVKCEPPSHQENYSGYVPSALEDTQISVSCLTPNLDLECKPRINNYAEQY